MARKTKTDREKLIEAIGPEATEEIDSMDNERLVARIAQAESEVAEVDKGQAADGELEGLKEAVKDAAAPYRDARKRLRAIQRYAHLRREEIGRA